LFLNQLNTMRGVHFSLYTLAFSLLFFPLGKKL
jgi:hypothetical protein